jgi:DNA-binding beta-propeller fold protein YncE
VRRSRLAAALLGLVGLLALPPGAGGALPVGALSQLPGAAGCVAEAIPGCLPGTPLDGATGVAVSPDGRHVYAAAGRASAILVLTRSSKTGALHPVGCVSETGSGGACLDGAGLWEVTSLAVSPDGLSVYATAAGSDSVVAFARDPETGALSELGCLSSSDPDCNTATALRGAYGVAVSPDGRSVYVAALWDDAVAAFARDPSSGHLTQLPGALGCTSLTGSGGACSVGVGLDEPRDLAVSPDGTSVYVAARSGDALLAFARLPGGELQGRDCFFDAPSIPPGCTQAAGLDGAAGVAVSPDGRSVYVAARESAAISSFMRDPLTGNLSRLAGSLGCIGEPGPGDCRPGAALSGAESVAVSPDGRSVYVASVNDDAVAAFAREPASGVLSQLPEAASCVSESGLGCRDGTALDLPSDLAVSPDGRSVYVASYFSDAVAAFARALPAGPRMGIGPRVVRLGGGKVVRLRLTCPVTATFCRGTVTLRARGLLLGRSSFGIAGGAARTVGLSLTQAGLALLTREHALVATVAATARDVQGDRRTTRARVTVLA